MQFKTILIAIAGLAMTSQVSASPVAQSVSVPHQHAKRSLGFVSNLLQPILNKPILNKPILGDIKGSVNPVFDFVNRILRLDVGGAGHLNIHSVKQIGDLIVGLLDMLSPANKNLENYRQEALHTVRQEAMPSVETVKTVTQQVSQRANAAMSEIQQTTRQFVDQVIQSAPPGAQISREIAQQIEENTAAALAKVQSTSQDIVKQACEGIGASTQTVEEFTQQIQQQYASAYQQVQQYSNSLISQVQHSALPSEDTNGIAENHIKSESTSSATESSQSSSRRTSGLFDVLGGLIH